MSLLKALFLFCERGLFFRLKLRIYDQATMVVVQYSFLEASVLQKLSFYCCLAGVSAAATRNLSL
jgi:hypothetical protein